MNHPGCPYHVTVPLFVFITPAPPLTPADGCPPTGDRGRYHGGVERFGPTGPRRLSLPNAMQVKAPTLALSRAMSLSARGPGAPKPGARGCKSPHSPAPPAVRSPVWSPPGKPYEPAGASPSVLVALVDTPAPRPSSAPPLSTLSPPRLGQYNSKGFIPC